MAKNVPANHVLNQLQQRAAAIPANFVARELEKVQAALRANKRSIPHLFLAGLLQVRSADYDAAITSLKKALKLAGNSEALLGALAYVHAEKTGNHGEALKYLRRKFSLNRTDANILIMMAKSHLEIGEPDKALEMLDRAEPLSDDKARIHALKAKCCLRTGDSAGARRHYHEVQRLDPAGAIAMADKIAVLPGNTKEDLLTLKSQLETFLFETPQAFRTKEHRTTSRFALGEVCEKLELFQEAFSHFEKANIDQPKEYDQNSFPGEFQVLHEVFSHAFFARQKPASHPSTEQVFIIGMPRSGTTLIESILAGHPKIRDFGELDYFVRHMRLLGIAEIPGERISQAITQVKDNLLNAPPRGFHDLGEQYIRHYEFHKLKGQMKLDKMPQNFMALGLIAEVFPHAKIIHARRHPMACCWSLFKHPLQGYHTGYANTLDSLGRYYLEYVKLMQKWQAVLPLAIHEVYYEDLIAGTQTTARAMVDFLGLDWDPACLDHTGSKRDVNTASALQVRQKIYTTSVDKWQHYQEQLKPLREALAVPIAEYEARLRAGEACP